MRLALSKIHARVLKGFRYVDDIKQFGQIEHWTLPDDVDRVSGDCDDFAIACRHLAKEAGFDARLVVCKTEHGEWHLVCSVGNYILDNRQSRLVTKRALSIQGYQWNRVSGFNPGDDWHFV